MIDHFTARAGRYDTSSRWCTDSGLMAVMVESARPGPRDVLLDVACGTGLVAKAFRESVDRVLGVDVTPAMYEQAKPHLDGFVCAAAESMPFRAASFDAVVCRQGLQFMDAAIAVAEMVRVTRPGGLVCLVNLCAYGRDDRERFFDILRLRNPARRNFFEMSDLAQLLREARCREVAVVEYVSRESVDVWCANGAISEQSRKAIREIYRTAPARFRQIHQVEWSESGEVIDHMLFGIATGLR